MLFTPESGKATPVDVIPAGALCFVNVHADMARSKEHGGIRFDLKLTVLNGPYKGRVVFDMFACPFDHRNDNPTKKDPKMWRTMAIQAMTRLFEVGGVFIPAQPETYGKFNTLIPQDRLPTEEEILKAAQVIGHELNGLVAAIKVKVEPEKDGHPPKNKVGEWLSSNPASGGYKLFCQLKQEGDNATETARQGAFGAVAAIPTAAGAATPVAATTTVAAAPGGTPQWVLDAQAKAKEADPTL